MIPWLVVFAQIADPEIVEIYDPLPPGASTKLDAEALERFERDDIHELLGEVPGVYVREEDGYGLRPNIGMRGASSDRSAKIAILEDGVPIAPAPYSAPAAYYFPLVTRMVGLDVTKGPSAIVHGPNTVGGVLELKTRRIPDGREATVDVAGGSDLYGKAHATLGWDDGRWGVLVEGVKLRSSGFKELDGGGPTGFDRNDFMLKARLRSAPGARFQSLELKAGLGTEISDETYTGLSDADFAARPYRRYAGTQLDRMEWTHFQAQLTHTLTVGTSFSLTTIAYRTGFDREWRKLNEMAGGRSISQILARPTEGQNAVFYSVLTGETDSSSPAEALIIGTNHRRFVAQGVESRAQITLPRQTLELGLRLHHDRADRHHTEDPFLMQGGRLVSAGMPTTEALDAVGSAVALSGFAKDEVTLGPVVLSAGLRVEQVWTDLDDALDPTGSSSASYTAILPGGGVVYWPRRWLALVAGVHRGFVPVAPGEERNASPEVSVNYEAGARLVRRGLRAELIGFFNDYSNLKGTCTFSAGCADEMLETEFDGGRVHVWGLEAGADAELRLYRLRFPVGLAYTLTRTSFQTGFVSANPQWGTVEPGDELPYLPRHQLGVHAGVAGKRWELDLAARFTSSMRDVAGQGETLPIERTDAQVIFDASAHVELGDCQLYLTVDNLFDSAAIVSRRPFGARPGSPRLVVVGAKARF
jgi:Fe(3+) dicitrate transport protein